MCCSSLTVQPIGQRLAAQLQIYRMINQGQSNQKQNHTPIFTIRYTSKLLCAYKCYYCWQHAVCEHESKLFRKQILYV